MPLLKGKGPKIRSKNVGELLDSYKMKGTIGNSKPASKEAAIKQAVAISYSMQRKKKGY